MNSILKGKNKIDKGFELAYYKLSYRRRFIRTLWMVPWAILMTGLLYWWSKSMHLVVLAAVILGVIGFIQATYNYKKWQEEING